MRKLLAFGDSFVLGDLDDFGPKDLNYNSKFPPTHGMGYYERVKFLKENVSFASFIAKNYNLDYENFAERGLGNFVQLDELLLAAKNGKIKEGDVILFGISISTRDRISVLAPNALFGIISPSLSTNPDNFNTIEQFDFFWILSVLESVRKRYKVTIIAFNLFYNPLFKIPEPLNFDFDFFIGRGIDNNTIVDVLNDTYGTPPNKKHVYHIHMSIPDHAAQFYTWNKHPSELGHIKIKNWLINYIDEHNIINK